MQTVNVSLFFFPDFLASFAHPKDEIAVKYGWRLLSAQPVGAAPVPQYAVHHGAFGLQAGLAGRQPEVSCSVNPCCGCCCCWIWWLQLVHQTFIHVTCVKWDPSFFSA
jgi:hypothetical protein